MPLNGSSTLEVQTLLTGLGIGESPRWHEDRLWLANWDRRTLFMVAAEWHGFAKIMGGLGSGQLLSVEDTGPGIPKEEIPRVMQAFGQGSLAHQTAEGGTGLGLPIVQNLVTLHGGTFELRSELRKGTQAVVSLPKSRVLRAMLPLQPLGRERHRQPVGFIGTRLPSKTKSPAGAGDGTLPSTAVR